MSTVPFASAVASGGRVGRRRRRFAGWRPALRMAWRDALHTKARSLLVVLLIAVPVGVLVFADVVIRTTVITDRQRELMSLGKRANAIMYLGDTTTSPASAAIPAGVEHAELTRVNEGRVRLGSKFRFGNINVADLSNPLFDGVFDVTSGTPPRTADEAAVTSTIAKNYGVAIGDDIMLRANQQHWRVVGIYEQPAQLDDNGVVLAQPPTIDLHDRTSTSSYLRAPSDVLRAMVLGQTTRGLSITRDPTIVKPYESAFNRYGPILSLYTAGTVGLFVIGIVISAAFSVAARRRLRSLGLAAASGSTSRQLRMTVVAQGLVAGIAGTLLGFGLGAIGVAIVAPRLERYAQFRLPGIRIVPLDLVLVALMAVATATIAALVPAISIARIPIGTALAGRRPLRPVSGHTPVIGLGMFVAGLVVLGASVARLHTPFGSWFRYVASGGLMLLGGVVCMPWLIGTLESLATRLRGSSRLAARSMARSRSRTGPITAAILAAAGATMTMASFDESSKAAVTAAVQRHQPGLSDTSAAKIVELDTSSFDGNPPSGAQPTLDPADVTRVSNVLPGSTAIAYDSLNDRDRSQPGLVAIAPASIGQRNATASFITMTPEALKKTGAPDDAVAALAAGKLVVMGPGIVRDGAVTLQRLDPNDPSVNVIGRVVAATVPTPRPSSPPVSTPVTRSAAGFETGAYLSASVYSAGASLVCDPDCHPGVAPQTIVVPASQVAELDKVVGSSHVQFRLPAPITSAQRNELRGLVSDFLEETNAKFEAGEDPAFVTLFFSDRYQPSRIVQAILLAVVTVAALVVTAIGLALSAAESRDEEATLLSLGAPPLLRRARRAWEALFTSGIACVLAVPLGFLPAAVVIANRTSGYGPTGHDPIVFPWRVGLTLGVALPLVAAGLFWVVTRPQRIVLVRED